MTFSGLWSRNRILLANAGAYPGGKTRGHLRTREPPRFAGLPHLEHCRLPIQSHRAFTGLKPITQSREFCGVFSYVQGTLSNGLRVLK